MTQNRVRNVANRSKRPDQARGVDGDDDEINVGFYPNELQPNSVQDNLDPPASMNETEQDPEQDITADNVQDPTNEPEVDPEQDQVIAADHADHAQDQNILQPPYNAPEHDDAALSPDAEPPPRPQRTRLPPTRLMYATPGQPANYHVNYIQQIPRYVEPFQRTGRSQLIPFMPGYVPPYHQLFMTPRVQFCHPQPSLHPQQFWNSYPITV